MCKTFALILAVIFLVSLVAFQPATVKAQSKTIIVPDDFPTIQAAIDNASSGDTVSVRSGVYKENIKVEKPLSLVGEDKATTIIDGNGMGTIFRITSTNVVVANFTIKNAGVSEWLGHGFPDSCVDVEDSSFVTVRNNLLANVTVGVWSYASSNLNISNNSVLDTTTMGIVAYSCMNNIINGNFVQDCGIVGIHLDGNSGNCSITNSTVIGCSTGIDIEKSNQNFLKQNMLLNDNLSAVFVESSENQVRYCTIENSSIGVAFDQSNDNTFTHNSFINNIQQVVSNFGSTSLGVISLNVWDNEKAGNYWSDYQSKYPNANEIDNSGIENTPYIIDTNNTDHYPLTHAFEIIAISPSPTSTVPEFPSWALLFLLTVTAIFAGLLVQFKKRKNLYCEEAFQT